MTNGERIRSMTDEELAKMYDDFSGFVYDCNCCPSSLSLLNCDNKCKEHCVEWLRKEYSGTW